jgi:hypothetical protein
MATDSQSPVIALETNFQFGAVGGLKASLPTPEPTDPLLARPTDPLDALKGVLQAKPVSAPTALGPLAPMVGAWQGSGFNTIFRPLNPNSANQLPIPATGDNILELNLTSEHITFTAIQGVIPNRGMVQADIGLAGMVYLQQINDVTTSPPTGIHIEPGCWILIPPTTDPAEGQTVCRMASIPHGTTINAQGTTVTFDGPPTIAPIDITPSLLSSGRKIPFASQTATNEGTPRIPQDLAPFLAAGKITQAMLDDPASILRQAISGQNIVSTTAISISTAVQAPIVAGGGTDNIAFLVNTGPDAVNSPNGPNANAVQMSATFWIETVEHDIVLPVFRLGDPHVPVSIPTAGHPPLTLTVDPGRALAKQTTIKLRFTQIQYAQIVTLAFNGLSWPHASVATLVPAHTIVVPPGAF